MMRTPRYLYKYRCDDEFGRRLLFDGDAWFSSYEKLIDIGDGKTSVHFDGPENRSLLEYHVYQTAKDEYPNKSEEDCRDAAKRAVAAHGEMLKQGLGELYADRLEKERRKTARVFCLTSEPDNSTMWAGFSNSGTGICIEFSTADRTILQARPVKYLHDDAPLPAREVVLNEKLRREAAWLFNKHDRWKHESEWRIVVHDCAEGVRRLPKLAVTGVIFGYAMPETRRNWYRSALKFRKIRLMRAVPAKGSLHRIKIVRDTGN